MQRFLDRLFSSSPIFDIPPYRSSHSTGSDWARYLHSPPYQEDFQTISVAAVDHILNMAVLLRTPSKMQVLSMGTYCLVMTLITSCATMPPVSEAILWSSDPPARTLSQRHVSKITT